MAKRGTNIYRVSVRGAGRRASEFDAMKRRIQDEIVAELRQYGREAQTIFAQEAPKDTEELSERIDAVPYFGRALRPRVSIRVRPDVEGHQGSGSDGYDYLPVTRFGHRKTRIVPVRRQALLVHVEGHRNPHAAIVRSSVSGVPTDRGSRFRGDWVRPAADRAEALAGAAERRLGRRVESRVLR